MARSKRTIQLTESASKITQQPLTPEVEAVLQQLEEQRATLETRLRRGEEMIATRRNLGEHVYRLETIWLGLLNEYEQVSQQIEKLLEQAMLQPAA